MYFVMKRKHPPAGFFFYCRHQDVHEHHYLHSLVEYSIRERDRVSGIVELEPTYASAVPYFSTSGAANRGGAISKWLRSCLGWLPVTRVRGLLEMSSVIGHEMLVLAAQPRDASTRLAR